MKDTSKLVIESDRPHNRDTIIFHTYGEEDGRVYEAVYEMPGIEYYAIKKDPEKDEIIRQKVLSNLREVPKAELQERENQYKEMIETAINESSFSD